MTKYYKNKYDCIYRIKDDNIAFQYIDEEWLYTGTVRGNNQFFNGLTEITESEVMLEML